MRPWKQRLLCATLSRLGHDERGGIDGWTQESAGRNPEILEIRDFISFRTEVEHAAGGG